MGVTKKVDSLKELKKITLHLKGKIQYYKDFIREKDLEREYLSYELKRLEKDTKKSK